jgi:hypothetical protein
VLDDAIAQVSLHDSQHSIDKAKTGS